MKRIYFTAAFAFLAAISSFTQEPGNILLPPPQTEGGIPLMKALKNRHTSREFDEKMLPVQTLSNLLWAAWGINREDQKKRTAPSSMNHQETEVYIAMATGLYLYDAEKNQLVIIHAEDIREKTGMQDFVKTAPLTLVYVADYSKMGNSDNKQKEVTSNTDAAFISQNVYLFCASEGLNTGVRAYINRDELHKAMHLSPDQHITLAQCVGFPK